MARNSTERGLQTASTTAHVEVSRDESAIELSEISGTEDQQLNVSSLPPVDRGKEAWLFLVAAIVVDMLVWGFPFAYGVFQEYYSSHLPFEGSSNIAIIGTCSMGVMYLSAPLVAGTIQRYPRLKRPCIGVGLLIMCLALGLSSLSQSVTHLIVAQGVFYAIGGGLIYSPVIMFMDEWFVKRKGLAFGVMWAGTGLGGVVLPIFLQYLLNAHGFRTTLRIWSAVLFFSAGPLVLFLKPRVPIARNTAGRPWDISFVTNKTFILLQAGNILEGLGFFVPSIYLPTIARHFGAGDAMSALPVILFNVMSVFGCVAMGVIIDRWHVTTCILVSTIGSTLSVFLIWGFSTSIAALLTFSVVYGLFAGSYSSSWPGIMRTVEQASGKESSIMVFAMLEAGRGIGNVVSGPLSEALSHGGNLGKVGTYGTEYGNLVVFTGVSAALGGVSVLGRRAGWM